MTDSVCVNEKEGEFILEFEYFVDFWGDGIYSEVEMALREQLQNSHDSDVKRRIYEPGHRGRIDIRADRAARLLIFEDQGIGMTEEEIHNYFCTIGRSGTREFREQHKKDDPDAATSLIGQFGVGRLSAFVIADKLVVETRSINADRSKGIQWSPAGGRKYRMKTIDIEKPGTRVIIHLKNEYLRLTNTDVLVKAVRKYADFLDIPIYINGEGPINTMDPPWFQIYHDAEARKKAYWEWVSDRFMDVPLEIIPIDIETPHPVKGALYIIDQRLPDANSSGIVDIYQKRMFVCESNRTLLPQWAKFVRGVIDSPALNLTAARDTVKVDTVHQEVQDALGCIIVEALQTMAKGDRQRFEALMRWHHFHVKGMAIEFDDFFDVIADYMPFEVTIPDTDSSWRSYRMMTVPEYLQEQKKKDEQGRNILYYISGDAPAPQFYQLCAGKGIVAINASLAFDEAFLKKYVERSPESLALQRVDVAESDALFEPLTDEERLEYSELEYMFYSLIQSLFPDDRVTVKTQRFAPSGTPVILTNTKHTETSRQLEYWISVSGMLSPSYRAFLPKVQRFHQSGMKPMVLHLNAGNPLIQRLRGENLNDPIIKDIIRMLYQNAFLYSQQQLTPKDLEILYEQTIRSLEHVIDLREQLEGYRSRGEEKSSDELRQMVERALKKPS